MICQASVADKRIETIFSQLTDQFLVIRNYAKITNGLLARIKINIKKKVSCFLRALKNLSNSFMSKNNAHM